MSGQTVPNRCLTDLADVLLEYLLEYDGDLQFTYLLLNTHLRKIAVKSERICCNQSLHISVSPRLNKLQAIHPNVSFSYQLNISHNTWVVAYSRVNCTYYLNLRLSAETIESFLEQYSVLHNCPEKIQSHPLMKLYLPLYACRNQKHNVWLLEGSERKCLPNLLIWLSHYYQVHIFGNEESERGQNRDRNNSVKKSLLQHELSFYHNNGKSLRYNWFEVQTKEYWDTLEKMLALKNVRSLQWSQLGIALCKHT
ncbi:hypothetical protein RFI_13242 [Reticulomyxa filosa]|uniref:Uncharacterized protein n=1 Tax=Reticulomyxa filosa TaxID=46433 RepID=X6NF12_RETFI|nr:hypothetical protein RFI_13242 [Reticulomyxa filosa]|eukprot:ETO23917.1 hypothetical protein RFI_13242 [Reticulomyxa filosa]